MRDSDIDSLSADGAQDTEKFQLVVPTDDAAANASIAPVRTRDTRRSGESPSAAVCSQLDDLSSSETSDDTASSP